MTTVPTADLLETVTQALGLKDPVFVEKDYYITKIIHALADIENEHFKLVFGGGTCLSKAHRIVKRMSEDVDYKIEPLSNSSCQNPSSTRRNSSVFREHILTVLADKTGLSPNSDQIIN